MIDRIPVDELRTAVAEWREAGEIFSKVNDETDVWKAADWHSAARRTIESEGRLDELVRSHLDGLILAAELVQERLALLRALEEEVTEVGVPDAAPSSNESRHAVDPLQAALARLEAMPRPDGDR